MSMQVLITGGTGFLGLSLADRLAQSGVRTVLFGITPPPQAALARLARHPGPIVTLPGDIRDEETFGTVLREYGISHIVHLAAISAGVDRERHDAREILDVAVLGALSVLTAAQRHLIRRVVLVSSAAVFGPLAFASSPLREDGFIRPDTLPAIGKAAQEAMLERLASLSGLDAVVARLSDVFGPYEYDTGHRDALSPPWQCWQAARSGKPILLPRPGLNDWLYAPDAALALETLLRAPRLAHRLYHVGPGTRWSLQDWCARLAQRSPALDWSLTADPTAQTITLSPVGDRAPLDTSRFRGETGFRPAFDLDAAFADFTATLES
jgi:nucleoside-diphosphate-sugar epimerase